MHSVLFKAVEVIPTYPKTSFLMILSLIKNLIYIQYRNMLTAEQLLHIVFAGSHGMKILLKTAH